MWSFAGERGGDAVGLLIVAAMSTAVEPSAPVSILSSTSSVFSFTEKNEKMKNHEEEDDEMVLWETYTCVVSHVDGGRKRFYFDDGAFYDSPPELVRWPPATLPLGDHISNCLLCEIHLHGRDIYMYRGDKPYCSEECRARQIWKDEREEKCGSELIQDCSISPCSVALTFSVCVAAAC